jgi:hypothetical protein
MYILYPCWINTASCFHEEMLETYNLYHRGAVFKRGSHSFLSSVYQQLWGERRRLSDLCYFFVQPDKDVSRLDGSFLQFPLPQSAQLLMRHFAGDILYFTLLINVRHPTFPLIATGKGTLNRQFIAHWSRKQLSGVVDWLTVFASGGNTSRTVSSRLRTAQILLTHNLLCKCYRVYEKHRFEIHVAVFVSNSSGK